MISFTAGNQIYNESMSISPEIMKYKQFELLMHIIYLYFDVL